MVDILRTPDLVTIFCDEENKDTKVSFELDGRKLKAYVEANESKPRMICLRWNYKADEPVSVMGDKWERSYGDMCWHSLNGETFMPWYFLATNGKKTIGCGVMTGCSSFVSFQYDASGVTAWLDVRCGGVGVDLSGRKLHACTFVYEEYEGISTFHAAKAFCKVMCENPILPKEPVYGSNNWYYAYGNSSYEEIIEDARLISRLAGENKNRPFMVIDDGWQVNRVEGPWLPNEKYKDMAEIATRFKEMGIRPGLWVRFLHYSEVEQAHPDWCIQRDRMKFLDPSHPEVKKLIKEDIERIKSWGYELIKHDYSQCDMFGHFGWDLNGAITNYKDWCFYDRKKTSAEITVDFYRLIKETAGDMYIIGCNTVSHLCAGLVEINRIGTDTSGKCWSVTRMNGVNTLAFRMCQNDAFYKVDADCVGLMGNNIPWKLNRQWLDLLSKSGSPLFVSMQPSVITPEIYADLEKAFKINSEQKNEAEPLDWMYNNEPQKWLIDGEEVEYDFVMDSPPRLLGYKIGDLSSVNMF